MLSLRVERARVRLGLESAAVPVDAWASVHRMGAFLAFQKPSLRRPAEKPITCKQQHRGQPVPIFFNRAHARHTQSGEIGEVDGPQPAQTALSLPLFRWSSSTSHFARATPNSHSFPGHRPGLRMDQPAPKVQQQQAGTEAARIFSQRCTNAQRTLRCETLPSSPVALPSASPPFLLPRTWLVRSPS